VLSSKVVKGASMGERVKVAEVPSPLPRQSYGKNKLFNLYRFCVYNHIKILIATISYPFSYLILSFKFMKALAYL